MNSKTKKQHQDNALQQERSSARGRKLCVLSQEGMIKVVLCDIFASFVSKQCRMVPCMVHNEIDSNNVDSSDVDLKPLRQKLA